MAPDKTLTLSLISHTNVGKTTLARTLLRRDVGEVSDQEHVTIENIKHTLLEAPGGEVLRLWDTPGFGDSARLLKRLRRQGNPIGWLLNETWDRFVNRPLWCSQQAVANVHDEADIVLYMVNATEDAESAGYVGAEMEVLNWLGKPVILVLNQIGEDVDRPATEQEEASWRRQVERFDIVRDVISLDAFTRCWVQEGVLLEHVGVVLPDEKRPVLAAVLEAWMERHRRVFKVSIGHLCEHLLNAAVDEEKINSETARKEAQCKLADRLERSLRKTIDMLIEAHGIDGSSREAIALTGKDYDTPAAAIDTRKAGVVGGIVSGLVGGVTADVLAGGLTFGGGMVFGAILGGLSAAGVVGGYNKLIVAEDQQARWTHEALDREAGVLLLRYLAVAHFGRGRGEWQDPESRKRWESIVQGCMQKREVELHIIWTSLRNGDEFGQQLQELMTATAREAMLQLYPGVERFID